MSKIQKILEMHPQLLHKVWRKAVKTIGKAASFARLTKLMNEILKVEGHDITLTIFNVIEFFRSFKGSLKREKFVPYLSDDKRKQRVEWCDEMQLMLKNNDFYICFIDEKWFNMSSGRNKEKTLPTAEFKTKETYIPQKSTRSRRHATKVMYMGIICPPSKLPENVEIPNDWQNGKIGMHRVSKKRKLMRNTRNQKFVSCGELNELIKKGDWRQLLPEVNDDSPGIIVGDFLDMIASFYDFDMTIKSHLCLSYETKN